MGDRAKNFLTTRQLARRWQVSEATIKRWADAGHLHSQKTLGGHRRFALADVLRFQNERGVEAGKESGVAWLAKLKLEAGAAFEKADAPARFFEAITLGHEGEATATLLKLYLDQMPLVKILEETVAAGLHRVGELWQCGKMSVADEHLATRTSIRAIESLRTLIRPKQASESLAVCCAVEDELHDIATLCVQLMLESEGWSVYNLGANTPFYALSDAVTKHRPRLVCASSTTNVALSRYARDYEQFQTVAREHQAQIVLGGEGFRDKTIRQRFPADLHAENFRQLVKFVKR